MTHVKKRFSVCEEPARGKHGEILSLSGAQLRIEYVIDIQMRINLGEEFEEEEAYSVCEEAVCSMVKAAKIGRSGFWEQLGELNGLVSEPTVSQCGAGSESLD